MVRAARALLAAAVAGLCSLLGLLLLPSPAAATEPVASVAITLTSMEPQLPTRDGDITVTGRVTNITKQRLYRLEALFWRNQAPIIGRAGLEQVYIKGDKGSIVLTSIGDEAVLTAMARHEAKLGMIFLEMRRAAEDLIKLVG